MTAGGGIRFGQYVLLKRIARGGMAEVFLAQQRGLEGFDRRVAVKRILPHLSDAPDFVKMFLGEAKLAAQLTHSNIVHIYDFGKVNTDYFIAMEFVDGVNAGQIWKHGETENDKLSPTLIARIGADCAAALNYAHELSAPSGKPYGLVHRDVSPANIMISFDGAVKLCDFGIAKAAAVGDQLTNPGQVKGKYAYMSPEQTTASPLDGRSDVFSLGIVLWELLAGKTIVGRGDAVDAMRAIRDGKLEPIEKAAPHTPPALAKAIHWALESRRERRATAAELATALEAFIKSSPELATPMQLAQWVRGRFVREMTGPQAMQHTHTPPGPGTAVGTGTSLSVVTPSALIAASTVGTAFSDDSETIAVPPMAPMGGDRMTARSMAAAEETTERGGNETVELDDVDLNETQMRGGYKPVVLNHEAVPTRITPALGRPPIAAPPPAKRSRRLMVGVLGGIALLSFLIAFAAKSCGGGSSSAVAPVPRDAAIDARVADAAVDAAIDASPTVPIDAAEIPADAKEKLAFLEVSTRPPGGTVIIGDQQRTAPAQFALPIGPYHVTAELEGWEPEQRDLTIEQEHFVFEIAFTRRVHTETGKKKEIGKLTAKTTPWSEVFVNGKKLGDTPLADVELPVGVYQMTFKAEGKKDIVKKVPIVAGKNTKVSFSFP